jgi:ribosome-binding protein aMBF1 (putative translation factor)
MGKRFLAPKEAVKAIYTLIIGNPEFKEENIPYDELVAEKIKKIGKGAMALKGLRAKENITQKELAKKLKIDQAMISKFENGILKIDIKTAKKIGSLFNINYKVFL